MDSGQPVMRIFPSDGKPQQFETRSVYRQTLSLMIGGELREVSVIKPLYTSCLECSACFEIATDPLAMCPSSHIVCRKCSEVELCPKCSYDTKTGHSTYPRKDKLIESFEIFSKKVPWICPVSCKMPIDHDKLKVHVTNCKPYQCSICREVTVATNELLAKHEAACPEKEISCRECELKIKQRDLKEHQSCCPEAEVEVNPEVFDMQGPNVKLKRKVLEAIRPESTKYLKDLLDAFKKISDEPDQNPESNGQITSVSGSCLQIPRENIKVLAETEFTRKDLFLNHKGIRKNLLNIPITPVCESSDLPTTYDTISIMIHRISYVPDKPDGYGLVCKLNNQTEQAGDRYLALCPVAPLEKKSQPAANKPYTFTLTGISAGSCEPLMEIRMSVNKILHDNRLSDFGRVANNCTPLDAMNFYQIFCVGFAGYDYLLSNHKCRLKLTVTEEC